MDHTLAILGRQPALGVAELESLYGGERVTPVGNNAALVSIASDAVDFARLGGTVKLCRLLTELNTTDWKEIEKFLVRFSPDHAATLPGGKMHLGLSAYDLGVSAQRLLATGLTLKKVIQKTGRSVRLVPNKSAELNTAQVQHNKLTGPTGWELVFVRDNDRVLIGQTVHAQDIDAYSQRDFGRPKRDARVGMLPPKLAQTIINLAAGPQTPHADRKDSVVLDPFCGTGVVLQEALLMGYQVNGTDLEPRMIDYTRVNLAWLAATYNLEPRTSNLTAADATAAHWDPPISMVASETYLGRPFTTTPSAEILAQTTSECNVILKKFLRNIHPQLQPGTRLCLAIPAWQTRPGQFKHLPLVDQLTELGYNRVRFERVRDADLLYYRPDQIVARELLVLTRV